ncbi:MAG TPA: amidohydrolase, partial [Chitinophagaceae bacterium]|nr:amidohydrolase [Chitinophagaceae bacterium]
DIIRKLTTELVGSMGAEADIHIDVGYPTVDNDPQLTQNAWDLANDYMGITNVEETELRMGSEDFGYYTQHIPGCFFRLGVRNEAKNIVSNVHTPTFDVDEAAIAIGAGMMAWLGASLNYHT